MSQAQNPSSLGTTPGMRVVEVSDKVTLSNVIAEELGKSGRVCLRASYSANDDIEMTFEDKKANLESISNHIIRRLERLQPMFGWDQQGLLVKKGPPCNGTLTVAVIRRNPGTKVISVTIEHDHAHPPIGPAPVVNPAFQTVTVNGSQAVTKKTTAPKVPKPTTQQSQKPRPRNPQVEQVISTPRPSVAKDILRAFGARPRTPELFIPAKHKAPIAPSAPIAPALPAIIMSAASTRPSMDIDGIVGLSTNATIPFMPNLPPMPSMPAMPALSAEPTKPTKPVNSAAGYKPTNIDVAPKKRGRPMGSKTKPKENSGLLPGTGLEEKPEKKKKSTAPRRRGIWVRNDDPRVFSPFHI